MIFYILPFGYSLRATKQKPFLIALTPFNDVRVNGLYRVGKCNYSFYWTFRVTLLAKEEQEMENPNNFPLFLFSRSNGSWNETKVKVMKLYKFQIKVFRPFNITFAISSQSLIACPKPLKIITYCTKHHVVPAPMEQKRLWLKSLFPGINLPDVRKRL